MHTVTNTDRIPYDAQAFGAKLRKLRLEKRLTQEQLGSAIGLSGDAIATYETGRSRPTCDTVDDLAKVFETAPAKLVEGLPNHRDPPTVHGGGAHLNAERKRKLLTKLVLEARSCQTLHVSVGDASFLSDWLDELYAESVHRPKIDRVRVLRLGYKLAEKLVRDGTLPADFPDLLQVHIRKIRRLLETHGVEFEEWVLHRLSRFHGFWYGDYLLFEMWSTDETNKLHVRSRLRQARRTANPQPFEEFEREFASASRVKPTSNTNGSSVTTGKPKPSGATKTPPVKSSKSTPSARKRK